MVSYWHLYTGFVKACLYLRIASGHLVPAAKLFLHLEDLLYVAKAKPHDHSMMCDSPIVQTKLSQSDSLCKYSHSSISCDSEFQSEVVKNDLSSKGLLREKEKGMSIEEEIRLEIRVQFEETIYMQRLVEIYEDNNNVSKDEFAALLSAVKLPPPPICVHCID